MSRWPGDIHEPFPPSVVQMLQRDTLERLGLREMQLQPEFPAGVEADVRLVVDLITLRSVMPEKTIDTARAMVRKVVYELLQRLAARPGRATPISTSRTPSPPTSATTSRNAVPWCRRNQSTSCATRSLRWI